MPEEAIGNAIMNALAGALPRTRDVPAGITSIVKEFVLEMNKTVVIQ
jgi:hypothetical protein